MFTKLTIQLIHEIKINGDYFMLIKQLLIESNTDEYLF